MKKIGLFLLAAAAAITLSSCNDDDNGDYASAITLGTVHVMGVASDYYFTLDNGQRAYPSDKTRIGAFTPNNGDRVVFTYNKLDTPADGFDLNIALYAIATVRMGETATVTTHDQLDALGDAKATPYQWCPTTRYNFNLSLLFNASDAKKHKFTLVRNNTPGVSYEMTESGYYNLELRHDTDDDTQGTTVSEWMTFNLTEFTAELQDMKGIIVKFETMNDGTRYFKFDLGK